MWHNTMISYFMWLWLCDTCDMILSKTRELLHESSIRHTAHWNLAHTIADRLRGQKNIGTANERSWSDSGANEACAGDASPDRKRHAGRTTTAFPKISIVLTAVGADRWLPTGVHGWAVFNILRTTQDAELFAIRLDVVNATVLRGNRIMDSHVLC